MSKQTSWIAQVQYLHGDKQPFWLGNFMAEGRELAKVACRAGVSKMLAGDYRLLRIQLGRVEIYFDGPAVEMNEDVVESDSNQPEETS